MNQDLPTSIITRQPIKDPQDMMIFATQYQQAMMLYEGVIKQLTTKLDILSREYIVSGQRNPISSVKSRVKSPKSIARKLEQNGFAVNLHSMVENLNDIAGIRVICPYICDIYEVRNMLLSQGDITLLRERDYIMNPKKSGYRSLHLVVSLPVFLSESSHIVRVEVQIRTMAMDFWASLEHQLRYKSNGAIPNGVADELQECAEVITQTDMRMERIARKLQVFDATDQPEFSPI